MFEVQTVDWSWTCYHLFLICNNIIVILSSDVSCMWYHTMYVKNIMRHLKWGAGKLSRITCDSNLLWGWQICWRFNPGPLNSGFSDMTGILLFLLSDYVSRWRHSLVLPCEQLNQLVTGKVFCHLHRDLPFSSRQHLSYDGCLEVRGEIIRTVQCYCVLKLCTVISTLRWAFLTVLWIGFCHTGPISLCIDLIFVFCVFFVLHICHIIVTRWDGPGGIES